jgi:hypothetical protein
MALEFELEEALIELDRIVQDLAREAPLASEPRPLHLLRTYDEESDTFLIHFYGRGLKTYSAAVHAGDHDPFMLLIERDSGQIVGVHFENFIHDFVQRVPSAAKMLANADWRPAATPRPHLAAKDRVTDSLDRVVADLTRVAS